MSKKFRNVTKILLFSLFCTFINLAVLEFCIYYYVKVMVDKHGLDIKNMVYPKEDPLTGLKKIYDKDLGWNSTFNTIYGERPRAKEYSDNFMAAFGDSFTLGSGISDHETFEEYLSEMLRANVFNFGGSAFGTDQAYLKFLEDFPKVRTKVVTLGLIMENINRLVNTYRVFYTRNKKGKLTKPRFKLIKAHDLYHINNSMILIPNPIKNESEIDKLKDINSMPEIGKFDYYFQKSQFWKSIRFPYSRLILSSEFLGHIIDIFLERFNKLGLWRDIEARSIMFKIIDNFVAEAKKQNSIPIVMILPRREDVVSILDDKKDSPRVKLLLKYCEDNNYYHFNGAPCLADKSKDFDDVYSFIPGHLSAEGNKLIAKCFYSYLKSMELLSKPKE